VRRAPGIVGTGPLLLRAVAQVTATISACFVSAEQSDGSVEPTDGSVEPSDGLEEPIDSSVEQSDGSKSGRSAVRGRETAKRAVSRLSEPSGGYWSVAADFFAARVSAPRRPIFP
jgi:hypothetical protein